MNSTYADRDADFEYFEEPTTVKIFPIHEIKSIFTSGKMSTRANSQVQNVTFSGDGQNLLINCYNDEMKILNVDSFKVDVTFEDHHMASIICSKFSPNSKLFFSAGEDNKVIVWNSKTGKKWEVFNMKDDRLKNTFTSQNANYNTNKKVNSTTNYYTSNKQNMNTRYNEIHNISDAAWLPNGNSILVAGLFDVYQLDVLTNQRVILVENVFKYNELRSICVSPCGKFAVVANIFDFKLINLESGETKYERSRKHLYNNSQSIEQFDDIQYVSYSKCGNYI